MWTRRGSPRRSRERTSLSPGSREGHSGAEKTPFGGDETTPFRLNGVRFGKIIKKLIATAMFLFQLRTMCAEIVNKRIWTMLFFFGPTPEVN